MGNSMDISLLVEDVHPAALPVDGTAGLLDVALQQQMSVAPLVQQHCSVNSLPEPGTACPSHLTSSPSSQDRKLALVCRVDQALAICPAGRQQQWPPAAAAAAGIPAL